MEMNNEKQWVDDRLAAIEPEWRPNVEHSREMLDAGLAPRRRRSTTWMTAAAAATLCIAAFAFPQPRAIAQELWYRFVLNRTDVVRVDLSKLSLHSQVTTNGVEQGVSSIDQAEQKAGYRPFLPRPDVLATDPRMTVIGTIGIRQTIRVRDLEAALATVGAKDVQVPPEWEGVTFRAEVGPMVTADYPDEVNILQGRSIRIVDSIRFPAGAFRHRRVQEYRRLF